ncbi:MAG: oligosaccharide flippase family protein [Bacilli bacterium]|jgi:O-antigen/teichoic acid export membrane protein|nr:oligosaccharide flippase family protein [Bacilli bacterium]
MRKKNSIKNMLAATSSNIITIIIGLVAQAIFIKILGTEYLGLNGLFSNIITMLGIVELGIGSAIVYNLYKPIADNDYEQIKSLMQLYKKSYHIIAIIVLIIGVSIIPVLPFFIEEVTVPINTNAIYLLFLLEVVFSYLLSYKRSILYANQKNFIVNLVHICYTILMNTFQLLALYIYKNFYIYLAIKILFRIIENIVITFIANKLYPYIKDKNVEKLDKEVEKDIYIKVKGLFFHKIGSFLVSSSDNLVISKMLGIITVGLYSNYYMIINSVQTIFNQLIQSMTASIGNLLVTEKKEKVFDVFLKIRFFNFWIASFSAISVLIIMESFINIWIGSKYLLPTGVLIVLCFNLYQKLMRNTYLSFKEASGTFHEDRFVPLIESFLNIFFSIILCLKFGLMGIFLGTVVSGLALWCYSYPKYVYKKLFDRSYKEYALSTLGYIMCFIALASISLFLSKIYMLNNPFLEFAKNVGIAVLIPNILIIVIFYKTNNFQYYKNMILKKRG